MRQLTREMVRPVNEALRLSEQPRLVILGASVRAAAQSAVRAGLRPVGADLFADEDVRAVADVRRVVHYPADLLAVSRRFTPCPWMYTGALENHPRLLAEISAERPLWGTPPESVVAVRDPRRVYAALAASDLPVLDVRPSSEPPPPDGRWMMKPLHGAAGRGIRVWNRSAVDAPTARQTHYFQQRVEGSALSAVILAEMGRSRLIGLTRQLIGEPWLHAPPFGYCGSIGPLHVPSPIRETVAAQGRVLAEQFGLRGLFGIDLLLDGEIPRPTEVNPRYTASVEVFERAGRVALLEAHRRACLSFADRRPGTGARARRGRSRTPESADSDLQLFHLPWAIAHRPSPTVGKAILYAERTLITGPLEDVPFVADRPAAGCRISAGHPVCTVFAAGRDEADCRRELQRRVGMLERKLFLHG